MTRSISTLLVASAVLALCPTAWAGLEVTALGKVFAPDAARVVISQAKADKDGSTSVRNQNGPDLQWKKEGYFERNRDLGQVITAEKNFRLGALVLRTGPSNEAVLLGAPGAKVFLQFFEVMGKPRINENGTRKGMKPTHGTCTSHRCDDFIEGITYKSIRIVKGGTFPAISPTKAEKSAGKLYYMRWTLTGDDRPLFEAGKRYAFLVGFEEPGAGRAFTLANHNAAGSDDPPSLTDKHDAYHGGWAIRREGNGKPPTTTPGPRPPAGPRETDRLRLESLLPLGDHRYSQSPGTDGYPDVDTYRDLEFYLERVA